MKETARIHAHLDGDRKRLPLVHTDADERDGRFSPDGRWMAYVSNATGRTEVYVTNYPSASGKWQVSTTGGTPPSGAPMASNPITRRTITSSWPRFTMSHPLPPMRLALWRPWAITSLTTVAQNGRIVALREIVPGSAPLTLVLNWREPPRGK